MLLLSSRIISGSLWSKAEALCPHIRMPAPPVPPWTSLAVVHVHSVILGIAFLPACTFDRSLLCPGYSPAHLPSLRGSSCYSSAVRSCPVPRVLTHDSFLWALAGAAGTLMTRVGHSALCYDHLFVPLGTENQGLFNLSLYLDDIWHL